MARREIPLIVNFNDDLLLPELHLEHVQYKGHIDAPTTGNLFAHDLIEHQKGIHSIGTIDDELIALGGSWYTRGCMNDYGQGISRVDPHQTLAYDLVRLAEVHFLHEVPLRRRTSSHTKAICAHDVDWILELFKIDSADMLEEYPAKDIERFIQHARALMQEGINRCHKRYGDEYLANTIFNDVSDSIDHFLHSDLLYEHQTATLVYHTDGSKGDVIVHY